MKADLKIMVMVGVMVGCFMGRGMSINSERGIEKESKVMVAESEATFCKKLDENPSVKKSGSGLRYEIIKEGNGKRANGRSSVTVHYVGTLINGKKFDSSRDRGMPATFPLNGVIKGFSEGLQLVGEGGEIKLYIPAALGYGNQSLGGIPGGSMLVFDISLISIEE